MNLQRPILNRLGQRYDVMDKKDKPKTITPKFGDSWRRFWKEINSKSL